MARSLLMANPEATCTFAPEMPLFKSYKKNYEVGTITGHSKGGRDAAVIGMQNKVPNIILYNAAPLNSFIGQGISTAINPTGGLSRLWNDGEMFLLVKNYKGRMIYFRSEKDPLTKSATITGSIYPGQTFLLENDKGHAITGFLDKEAQTFISGKLLLVDKNGKVRSGLEVATEIMEMNLKGLNELRKSFLKDGGGRLSAAQEEFLDASEALALTQGIQQTVQDELAALKKDLSKRNRKCQDVMERYCSGCGISWECAYPFRTIGSFREWPSNGTDDYKKTGGRV